VAKAIGRPIGCPPLGELCRGKRTVCIAVSDHTRPLPGALVVPELVRRLQEGGMALDAITVICATGLHRATTADEIRQILGSQLPGKVRVISHDARDRSSLLEVGRLSCGVPLTVARPFAQADLRMVVSLVEPHFMAGYSGGRKMVLPGLASRENIFAFHSPRMLAHPRAATGVLDGNPVHEMALEAARAVGVDFCVNVTIDADKRLTGVFAGELVASHLAAVKFGDGFWSCATARPADVVIVSGGGAPLDATFYQAIKGAVAGAPVVKQGGTVIVVAECAEGLGSDEFVAEMRGLGDPQAYLDLITKRDRMVVDQWQLQKLANVMVRAEVVLVSALPRGTALPVEAAASIDEAMERALAGTPKPPVVHVIPAGPYVIAGVQGG